MEIREELCTAQWLVPAYSIPLTHQGAQPGGPQVPSFLIVSLFVPLTPEMEITLIDSESSGTARGLEQPLVTLTLG